MRKVCALVACLLLAAAPAQADDYAAIHARAAEAFASGDLEAFRAAVLDALKIRPDYPPMLFNLAVAQARLGQDEDAAALLWRLVHMGLVMPADAAAFPSLVESPEFDAIVEGFEANTRPVGQPAEVARLEGERDFLPEGIAADPATGDLFIGSVRQARIVRVDARTGEAVEFAADDPQRLWGVFGMRVANGRLWVATSAVPETLGVPESVQGLAAILVYDLQDGSLVSRCVSEAPAVFGDVLPAGGGAWVSDSTGGVSFVDPGDCAWSSLVARGRFVSPQGMADGGPGRLIVADYRGGLFSVDTTTGQARRLAVPENATVYGIDGLDRSGEWLLAVQNGLRPHRILALRLSPGDDAVTDVRVLAGALDVFDEPTQGVVHGRGFAFIANSGWPRYAGGDGGPGSPPVILSVAVPEGP